MNSKRPESACLLTVTGLTKRYSPNRVKLFPRGGEGVLAVDDVSFSMRRGRTLGVVGESGSGKSTLAKMLIGLESPTSGSALFQGIDICSSRLADRRFLQRSIQMVPQDPYTAMNPRFTIFDVLTEPWRIHAAAAPPRATWPARATLLLEQIGLSAGDLYRYPQQFSGGQQQRISLARALLLGPELIICDEVLSALDVSVQAQILQLLVELKSRLNVTFLFISHDLSVVREFAEDVVVMYHGKLVECGETASVYHAPKHPYTKALLGSVLTVNIDPPEN